MDKSPTSDNNDADEKVDTGQIDTRVHSSQLTNPVQRQSANNAGQFK